MSGTKNIVIQPEIGNSEVKRPSWQGLDQVRRFYCTVKETSLEVALKR
jgi:hypothetical protein